jgi:hypothetical protein
MAGFSRALAPADPDPTEQLPLPLPLPQLYERQLQKLKKVVEAGKLQMAADHVLPSQEFTCDVLGHALAAMFTRAVSDTHGLQCLLELQQLYPAPDAFIDYKQLHQV